MESPSPVGYTMGRRRLLRLAALAPATAVVVTGCDTQKRAEPDPLLALATAARSDAALAQAIARNHSGLSDKASAVAIARTEHARALQREIDRVNPPAPDTPPPPPPAQPAPPSPGDAKTVLSEAIRTAQRQASGLVPAAPNYRAGLLGSVSASCASLLEVLA